MPDNYYNNLMTLIWITNNNRKKNEIILKYPQLIKENICIPWTLTDLYGILRPPGTGTACPVVLPALVIKAVRDLVTDHHPDGAVVEVSRPASLEERRL